MLLCYITDRTQFPGDEASRRSRLLEKIAEAARCGVDSIQLREKNIPIRDLERLACEVARVIAGTTLRTENGIPRTVLLINSRVDVAIAAGADGVHLRSDDIKPAEVRQTWNQQAGSAKRAGPAPVVTVSCHSVSEVAEAAAQGADVAVFAPVFEKRDSPSRKPAGLEALRQACQNKIPVLALGGVTVANAYSCLAAGAAGIAAIRLFQEHVIADVVNALRG